VRPSLGEELTLVRLRLRRDVVLCDLRPLHRYESPFVDSESGFERALQVLDHNEIRRELGASLALPIRPDDAAKDYLLPQFICNLAREEGFDGVAYGSSQRILVRRGRPRSGTNILLFDPLAAVVDLPSRRTYRTANASFIFTRSRA